MEWIVDANAGEFSLVRAEKLNTRDDEQILPRRGLPGVLAGFPCRDQVLLI